MLRPLLTLVIIFILAAACESPANLDLNEFETKLAIISNFAPNQPVQVQVSKTQSVLDGNNPVYLEDAIVLLYRGNTFLETLQLVPGSADAVPYYVTENFQPQVGEIYTLKVEAPGFKQIQATSQIPAPATIRGLGISNVSVQELPQELAFTYKVSIVFDDPLETSNYYHLNFYQQIWNYQVVENDTVITGNWLRKIAFNPQTDNNSLIAYFDGGVLFDDASFNGKTVGYSFVLETSIDPDRHMLGKMFTELRTASKEYYLFHNSLSRQQTSSGGPLSEPVIIYNNIENGQGIFAGYSPTIDSVAIFR
ncbi:MAG: DUF4249 domain-containing protein [Saprospiraceae bacterium]|nr:DUF4249 domain-containing protein [Saprospiraceae bacterium]